MKISLRAGWSRVRIPTRELFFSSSKRSQWRWAPQEHRNPHPWEKRKGVVLTIHLHITYSLRKSGVITLPLHPINNFMTWSEMNTHLHAHFCCYAIRKRKIMAGFAEKMQGNDSIILCVIFMPYFVLPGWAVRDRIPVGDEIFRPCPDRPWGPPSLLYNGYRVFPGGKDRPGRDADLSSPF